MQAIDRAKREGWLSGYRAALGDVETLSAHRAIAGDLPGLIADMREDAKAIEREDGYQVREAPREKLAADRLRQVATLRKQRLSVAEIGMRLGVSKSRAGQLVQEAESVQQSSTIGRKVDGE